MGQARDSNPFEEAPTISTARRAPAAVASRVYVLRVVEGPDQGKVFRIDADQAMPSLLGKSSVCDLLLTDPSVSRRHASIEHRGNNLAVEDLGSTNGTFIDGVRVMSAFAHGGELIRVGSSALEVTVETEMQARTVVPDTGFGSMLGASAVMRRLYPLCRRLAQTDIPVVIEGETGTGKEVLAESLHNEGPRRKGPFVVFDCTTVAPNLIESVLFGHVRGAFTGAVSHSAGVFEQANGGTLFIDEIGDLPLPLQAKLLRAIERREVYRVGGHKRIRVDVRILAATRRDLDREVQEGRFRDDLFHRLAVARIELPPLRKRQGDVPLLVEHFVKAMGGNARDIPSRLMEQWESYSWPGNVRELRNAVARWLALGDIDMGDAAAPVAGPDGARHGSGDDYIDKVVGMQLPLSEARRMVMEEFQRRYVAWMLEKHGGNVTRAAAAAGVARRHFQRLKSDK